MTARRTLQALAVLLATLAVLLLGGGWYFSDEIRRSALEVRPAVVTRDLQVVSGSPSAVTLRATGDRPEELDEGTTYGLDWGSGYGQVTQVLQPGVDVTRRLTVLTGAAPEPGQPAGLLRDAFPDDPRPALGPGVREVAFRSPAGDQRAWLSSGDSTTWAVLVHGRGATRTEVQRLMRSTAALGLPSLAITYRRDPDDGGGLARFGQDEWADLEAAVRYALDRGAERVVLAGASMGGAIAAAFLERSALADRVVALVLDSPMLDLGATISHGAAQRELPVVGLPIPAPLTWTAKRLAGWRFGIDDDAVDYLDDSSWLEVPALVLHGTQDDTVPDSVSRRLAAAHPRLVRLVAVEDAGHVESWNLDPQAYDDEVRSFLAPFD